MTIGMVVGLYVYVLFSLKKNRKKFFPILSLLLKVQKLEKKEYFLIEEKKYSKVLYP